MTQKIDSSVLVVGAGPVGIIVAMDLASRGIDVVVLESRRPGEPPSVKSNHVSARSMEIFRRLGVVEKVRNAGLPADYPNDVAYRTSFLGPEIARIKIPCRADRYTAKDGPDTWWPTPEPPHRINQTFLEPVLLDHLAGMPGVRILQHTRFLDLAQKDDGVTAIAEDIESGAKTEIACKFLIGCDGGRSLVRKKIGAELSGVPVVARVQSTYIRAPKLLPMLLAKGGTPAWGSFAVNPRRTGNVYAIDGREKWLIQAYLYDWEQDFDSVDRDAQIRTMLGVDRDFPYEVLSIQDWFGRRLVANKLRDRRVFICGDASHVWVPFAGYGMNAGIADAANLAWTLAAYLQGWGDEGILDVYERERLPITEQVSHFAMSHAIQMAKAREAVPDTIEQEGAEGDAVRAKLGKAAYDLNVQQYCCAGLNFGYFYDRSPIIAYDGEKAPDYSMADFTASTVPGARLPHFWLPDGRSLYDALGPGYALLRFDPTVDVLRFVASAEAHGVPLRVLDAPTQPQGGPYRHALVLSRPDGHVAWRGNRAPEDTDALIDLIRGAPAALPSSATVAAA